MRTFNYSEIKKQKWDSDVLSLIAAIYKEAGKQEMYLKQRPEELEKLVDLIYQSNEICFAGNFFTQSVSMQLQIELSYLGKKCTGMYPLQSQKEVVRDLTGNDLIIVSSIAGGYWQDHPDMLREIAKSRAHKICITQVENIPYQEQFDMIIQVGTDHLSLIGKFSITYIFELLEALYHIKYGRA